ncbi:MAG: peptidylprolyl isomerase [Anaerolineales bacterium]|nr:peptidylprolyl isomerase [Anaerolineales bacterium]
MANKKKVNKVEAQKSEKTIQYIAIAVILIVIGIIAWPYIPKPQPTPSQVQPNAANVDEGSPACGAFDSIAAADQYNEAPPLLIDESKQYLAAFKMANGGEFVIQLYPDKAPITVNSFVFLACKGFYNGVTFHRVLEGFMAQGGDPDGTGGGGPGYEFVNENSDLTFDKDGVVAMANAGPDTNGSQFFITYGPQEFLNGGYTIFGQVIEGMDVVNAITRRDPDQSPSFEGDAIESVTITQQ